MELNFSYFFWGPGFRSVSDSLWVSFWHPFWIPLGPRCPPRVPKGAQEKLEEGVHFSYLFSNTMTGGPPPPLKTHRHHLRCPATSALGGGFRRKMKGKQTQKAWAYHLESRIQGKLELELRLTVSLTYKGGFRHMCWRKHAFLRKAFVFESNAVRS